LAKFLRVNALEIESDKVDEEIILKLGYNGKILPQLTINSDFVSLAQFLAAAGGREARMSLLQRASHQDLLLVNMLIWEQLEKLKAEASQIIADSTLANVNWFVQLARDLLNRQSCTFDAQHYLPDAFGPDKATSGMYTPPKRKAPDSQWAINEAETCFLAWLRITHKEKSKSSALFTRLLVAQFGVEVLLIDEVWRASTNLSHRLIGADHKRIPDPHLIAAKVRECIDLVVDMEKVQQILTSIHIRCTRHRQSDAQLSLHALTSLASSPPLHSLLPPAPLPPPPPPPPPPSIRVAGSTTQLLNTWIDQIRICLKLLPGCGDDILDSNDKKTRAIHKFLSEVMEEPDQRFPFREFAPSRFRVRTFPDGPFSPHRLRTAAGFFSACVARSITHGTKFLQKYPVYYDSCDKFLEVVADASEIEGEPINGEYFCRRDAYGQYSHKRKIDNVVELWDSCHDPKLNGWLVHGEEIQFSKLVTTLSGTDFPGIGALTAFQIAVDYAKEGVLDPPQEDFVEAIRHVNMGGVEGLRNLGLLPTPPQKLNKKNRYQKDKTMVELKLLQKAFSRAEKALVDAWDSNVFPFDQYDVEHWLCKSSGTRLGRASYFDIYK
jgi:hypothetical protein